MRIHPRRFQRATFLLLLPLLAPALRAQAPSDAIPLDPAVTVGTLENGLRYYIRRNARPEDRAELRLVVNAGSVLEDPDQLGLAHLVEHMAFNGTESFEKQELVDYLESVGMQFGPSVNAYTSFDETVYMLQVPTDDDDILEKGIQILEEWAHRLSFEGAEIDKERGVVIEEWRMGLGADARIRDQQFPVLFQGSRYAERLPIGDPKVLESFPHEALVRFYRTWYRPELMAVVAVGDFDAALVERLIVTRFSQIPARSGALARPSHGVPDHDQTLYAIATDPEATGSSVAILVKQDPKPTTTLGDYRQLLVERLATGILSNRLFELTQQADPPYVYAGAGRGRFVRTKSFFQLVASAPDGGIPRGMEALLTEAERAARHGFTPGELAREKADMLRGLERAYNERENQESSRLASEYRDHFLEGEPAPGIEFEHAAAQALVPGVTLEEVNAVARSNLAERNRVVLVDAPQKAGVPVPSREELEGVFAAVDDATLEPYQDTASDDPLLGDPPAPGRVVREGGIPELGVTEWVLSNGVRVWIKPTDFKRDEVYFRAFSPGGYSLSSLDEHESATNAVGLVSLGGVGSFSLIELQKKLAGKTVQVSPRIDELSEGMSGMASPGDLETALQLVYLYFTAPRRDPEALESFKSRIRAFLENRSASPMAVFQDTLTVTLAQGHPRMRPPTLAMLDEIDLDEALAFYRDRFADAGDFHFVFVGALDPVTFRPLVEKYLGSLPATDREESFADLDIDPPSGVVDKTVRKGLEPQAQTRLVFNGPFQYTAPNRVRVRALAGVLELRLRERMREDLGGTYNVAVQGSYEKEPEETCSFLVDFGSAPGRVAELTRVVLDEIARLQAEGPTEEELVKVKEQERRARETNLQENGWWVAQLAFSAELDQDPRYLLDGSLLEAVTQEGVREDALRYLRLDNYVRVSLVPENGPIS